jgi:hypothetical protein
MANIYWGDEENCSPSLKSWLTISKDRSKSQVFLTMTNMDPKTWAPIIVLREDSDIASGVTCT